MDISIIIPNYNGESLLKKNLPKVLEAVQDYSGGKIEIIIPNDPSTDKSEQVIDDFIKGIDKKNIRGKTISNTNTKYAGFSRNVQRGVKIANGEILILFNSDVYPHRGFLVPLISHFTDPTVFAVGCLDESVENGEIILRGRGLAGWKRGFLIHRAGVTDKANTFWVSGGSGAFKKDIWEKLSGFDPIYDPFYWEDIDLSYRAQKSGYKILFEPKSIVTHEHEEGIVKKKFDEEYVKKISYRNQFIFIWKNITDMDLWLSHILWLPYNFISAFLRADWQFFGGFSAAIFKIGKILKEKKVAQKQFIKKDKELISIYE